ncbi:alpha/beta fold hydrolase [Streptomyces sp. XD-27]|uniref:alpha/beta fold hydrolase n=1 Tax=Streptomyces sp. XD-27 TaxID=3062779 RepID=UPI0026F41E0B|nr:alpha/beta hydrolase [Streptomyces sp. XD-27]WKX73658.1 alpha/beta hydrolase [Streptomyces sp. XD-27]
MSDQAPFHDSEPRTGTLKVPGATLHYEVRGTGPLLLLIPGGSADAAVYDPVAADLADRYTVVSYDPRGFSRSPLDDPAADGGVAAHSDDAHRLLAHLAPATPGGEPAYVFGSSSSAIVALDLLTRHPEQVALAVAHEPQTWPLLPDGARMRALFAEVRDTYRAEGLGPALALMQAEFAAGDGAEEPPARPEPRPLPADVMARMQANMPVFLEHVLPVFTGYEPDLDALRAVADRLRPAAGRDSRGHALARPVAALAERLGTGVTEFPGSHIGVTEYPAEFAKTLADALRS